MSSVPSLLRVLALIGVLWGKSSDTVAKRLGLALDCSKDPSGFVFCRAEYPSPDGAIATGLAFSKKEGLTDVSFALPCPRSQCKWRIDAAKGTLTTRLGRPMKVVQRCLMAWRWRAGLLVWWLGPGSVVYVDAYVGTTKMSDIVADYSDMMCYARYLGWRTDKE